METKETVLYHLQHLRQLVFEVTDSCNLNCSYCGVSHLYEGFDNRNGKYLPFKKARVIIDYLFSIRDNSPGTNYPLTISFYGGEPLLNTEFIRQVIEYLNNPQFPKVNFSMTTNGVLLDKYMSFLVNNKFRLLISFDGNETGNSYRIDHSGKSSYHRVFKNINLLLEKYPKYFQEFVLFNSVIHNRNDPETTYHWIKDHFDKVPLLAPLNTTGIKKEKIQEFKKMYLNVNDSIVQSVNCEYIEAEMFIRSPRIFQLSRYIFNNNGNVFYDFNDLVFDISGMNTNKTGTCTPFSKKMFITVEGKILQCERIPHQFAIGQIQDESIDLDLESIAEKQNKHIARINKQCNICYLNNECPQCVYNIDDLCSENSKCPSFSNEKQYKQHEEEILNYLREHPHYYNKILKEVTLKY